MALRGAAAVAAAALCAVPAAAQRSPAVPPDPVGSYDFPDPVAIYNPDDSYYYAFGGSQAMRSKDLASWSSRWSYRANKPKWVGRGGGAGAPGVARRADGKWVLFFQDVAANATGDPRSCIGAAISDSPHTPFVAEPEAMVCMPEHRHVVDASPRMIDGQLYLYWKSTGSNTLQKPSELWGAKLASDGLSFAGPWVGPLLQQTESWEARNGLGCVEAPAILYVGGVYRLFYSGGDWTAGLGKTPYSIGYGDCSGPLGPCKKVTTDMRGPWYGPTGFGDSVGTGGQEFFTDAAGAPWVVYHAWRKGHAGYGHGGERTVRFHPLSDMPAMR